jgi:hypothetical protein
VKPIGADCTPKDPVHLTDLQLDLKFSGAVLVPESLVAHALEASHLGGILGCSDEEHSILVILAAADSLGDALNCVNGQRKVRAGVMMMFVDLEPLW